MVPWYDEWDDADDFDRGKDDEESIQESVIKIFSANFFYKKYNRMTMWYLMDIWKSKWTWRKAEHVTESEMAMTWQAIMALRRIFKERGFWDGVNHEPIEPGSQVGCALNDSEYWRD